MEENVVLYDALSMTSKIDSTATLIEMLGLEDVTWEVVKGAHGYRDRLYWNCISIHFNGTPEMGIWLELTGQGCRAFETYGNGNYEALFQWVVQNPGEVNLTRLDVAFDDHSGLLDIKNLCNDTIAQEFVSKFTDWQVIQGSRGAAINHGSMKSDIFLRIYDKAMERGFDDGRHWIRVELQLRRDRAIGFVSQAGPVGVKYAGVLRNYLAYVQPQGDSNKWRWPMKEYWSDLLGAAERIRLYVKPGAEYNMENLENYVYHQAGNAVAAMIEIVGEDEFRKQLRQRGTASNPKYKRLISEYGRDKHENTGCM